MVHDYYYGVYYIIVLTQPIDYYDDLLPICIANRHDLKERGKNKICIFNERIFDKRLCKEEMTSFKSAMFELNFNSLRYNHTSPTCRDTLTDLYVNYDCFIYSNFIKHNNIEVMSDEEFDNLTLKYENFNNEGGKDMSNDEYLIAHHELNKSFLIQTVLKNKNFDKVVELEKKLTNIELTEEEKTLINNIVSHPKLNGIIKYHGFELVNYYY
jgi:hypothetical protein